MYKIKTATDDEVLIDDFDKCYHVDNRKKMYCTIHKRTQVSCKDSDFFYCPKC